VIPRLFTAVLLGVIAWSSSTLSLGQTPPRSRSGALSCPRRFQSPTFSDYPALRRTLVPHRPSKFLICRYRGLKARHPGSLAATGFQRGGRRLRLVVQLYDRLPKAPARPIACSADDERVLTVQFRYRRRPDDLIQQSLSGCRFATNGHRTVAIDRRGRSLLRLLRRMANGYGLS
jgi:hypothetical protein